MVVHHAVGISRQRNSGYRPRRVNIMAQGLCTPDPSLSPTHLSIMKGCTTTTHYTHNQVSLMVSRNTTLVPSLGLRTGPACEAGLNAGMRRERVPPQRRKKEGKRKDRQTNKQTRTNAFTSSFVGGKLLKLLQSHYSATDMLFVFRLPIVLIR